MRETMAGILLLLSAGGLLYNFLATLLLLRKKRRHGREQPEPTHYPPVSVLKPLKGIDEQLEKNLESFFLLNYPNYEIIFGVKDADDPVVEAVMNLRKKFPEITTALVISDTGIGLNPKINNLNNMFHEANHDLIIINDSNIRVSENYLCDMVRNIKRPGTGLATSTVRGVGSTGIGSVLENLHLNSFIAASTIFINDLIGIPVSIGKSMIIRRETLERIGGFRAFSDFLLEDELIGRKVRELGLKTCVSIHCVDNCNSNRGISKFLGRQLRWATLRRHFKFFHYIVEPLSNPVFLAAAALIFERSSITASFAAVIMFLKILNDRIASATIGADHRIYHYLLVPVKDIIIGMLWMVPFVYAGVKWRGNRFVITKRTRLVALENRGFSPRYYGWFYFLLNINPVVFRIMKLSPRIRSLFGE